MNVLACQLSCRDKIKKQLFILYGGEIIDMEYWGGKGDKWGDGAGEGERCTNTARK